MPPEVHPLLGEMDVRALRRKQEQRQPQRIGAVLLRDLDRIGGIPERLGHLAPLRVPHDSVQVHHREGRLAHEFVPGHHHACHPEEDDVGARDEDARGIEPPQILRLPGPAQRGERPEPGGEPGVQHVLVLLEIQSTRAALRAARRLLHLHDGFRALGAGPDRDAMPPPELARDAPVADSLEPAQVHLLPAARKDGQLPLLDRLERGLGERLHRHEPLEGKVGLHDRVAALAVPDGVAVRLHARDEPPVLQRLHDARPRFLARQPAEIPRVLVHGRVGVHHHDGGQAVPLAQLEVVGIVGRRHFHRARPELWIHRLVEDDRDLAAEERQDGRSPLERGVALVLGVHRHRHVPQHRLGARGRHHDVLLRPLDGIHQVVELAVRVLMVHFLVGERGEASRAPVDDPVAAVDESLVVETHEHFADRAREPLVHGEALARPVHRIADAPHLGGDPFVIMCLPLPDFLEEGLAA